MFRVFFWFGVLAGVALADPPAPSHGGTDSYRAPSLRPEDFGKAREIFEKSHGDEKVYVRGACADNICRVLKRIEKAQVDLKGARVLYLLRQSDEAPDLYPQRARQGIAIWGFHVVLEWNGMILDLDYGYDPVPVPARRYFTTMFGDPGGEQTAEQILKQIQLRSVPAEEYLADYPDKADYPDYLANTVKGRDYPAQSAWRFLESVPPDPASLASLAWVLGRIRLGGLR